MCSPTAADAVLNVQDLEAVLASGNATVTTTGTIVQATNIHVDARFTWSASNTLTLDAFRLIELNRKVTVAGTGAVSLITNDGGSGGEFACDGSGRLHFNNLASTLTINSAPYALVSSVASLKSAIAANPSGTFALAKNYDAKKDGTYVTSPVSTVFSGSFNGLGNAISNLSINNSTEDGSIGLFAETMGGSIANIRLLNENVQVFARSQTGGLVGWAIGGSIAHSFTTGSVTGGDSVYLGGLIGNSTANVVVSGSAVNVVSNSVAGNEYEGGLIGVAGGPIADSYANGSVSGSGDVGGLVGKAWSSSVQRSWASGGVSGSDGAANVGGLVGENSATIARSHASGNVTCQSYCGGLVGIDTEYPGKISQSFATGNISGYHTGGLVGGNGEKGEISDSYALGAVTGYSEAGGLVGENLNGEGYHAIARSYSTGTVTGQSGYYSGGLIGDDLYASTTKHAYWDMTTSGITDPSQGAGNVANDPGIKGLSDKKLKAGLPKGFNPKIWNEDSSINGGLPYLINNPPQS
jgi:hypothetical protein